MVNIAILGYGTVGSGVAEVFGKNRQVPVVQFNGISPAQNRKQACARSKKNGSEQKEFFKINFQSLHSFLS